MLSVFERDLANLAQCLTREVCLVRRNNDIGEGAQTRSDRIEDLACAVLVDVWSFFFVYVEAGSADGARKDTTDECLRIYKAAATGVDEDDALLHLADGSVRNHVVALVVEEGVQADKVGICVERIEIDKLINNVLIVYEGLVGVEVIAQNFHTKALADAAKRGADAATTDDTSGFAMQRIADKT